MFKNQKGFTIVELLIAWALIAVLVVMGFGVYAVYHFVVKYW